MEAGYYWNPYSHNETDGIATYRSPAGADHTGKGGTYLNNRDRRGYINLYYAYSIDTASKIAFNVVNSWGRAKAYNRIWREFRDFPDLDYDMENLTDNHTYSLMASTYFYKATPKSGMFSAGANWTYTRLNQENDGIRNIPETNSGFFYAGWQQAWGFFTLMPTPLPGSPFTCRTTGAAGRPTPYPTYSSRCAPPGAERRKGLSATCR